MKISTTERFWSKVVKTDTCWIWIGAITSHGYGIFRGDTKPLAAHRFSYLLINKEIPAGKELDHLCRVRGCVNPEHLEAVTHSENMKRAFSHQELERGNRWKRCKRGHELIEGNLHYINAKKRDGTPRIDRCCLKCRKDRARKYLLAKT